MDVAGLIEVLAGLPGDLRVVVDAQEGGYEDPVLDADRITDSERDAGDWFLGPLRRCGRGEDGEVALVVGRGAGRWTAEPQSELHVRALEAARSAA